MASIHRILALLAAAALCATAAFPTAGAQEAPKTGADAPAGAKIADIQGFTGAVTIKAASGETREPKLVAKRVRGGALYNGETVSTAKGASVEILFLDSSKFTLAESGSAQIEERRLAKANERGQTFGRKIKVLAGKVVSEIQPSKEIVTEFETPAGVAAVRGTLLTVTWTPDPANPAHGTMDVTVDNGAVDVQPHGTSGVRVVLENGDVININRDATGRIHIRVPAGFQGQVDVQVGDKILTVDGGDGAIVDQSGTTATVTVTSGEIPVTNVDGTGDTLGTGDSMTGEVPPPPPPDGDGSVPPDGSAPPPDGDAPPPPDGDTNLDPNAGNYFEQPPPIDSNTIVDGASDSNAVAETRREIVARLFIAGGHFGAHWAREGNPLCDCFNALYKDPPNPDHAELHGDINDYQSIIASGNPGGAISTILSDLEDQLHESYALEMYPEVGGDFPHAPFHQYKDAILQATSAGNFPNTHDVFHVLLYYMHDEAHVGDTEPHPATEDMHNIFHSASDPHSGWHSVLSFVHNDWHFRFQGLLDASDPNAVAGHNALHQDGRDLHDAIHQTMGEPPPGGDPLGPPPPQ